MYHVGPGSATPKSKKLSRGNPETPLDFSARCAIVGLVESVRDTDRANGHPNGTDTTMTLQDCTIALGAARTSAKAARAAYESTAADAEAAHAALSRFSSEVPAGYPSEHHIAAWEEWERAREAMDEAFEKWDAAEFLAERMEAAYRDAGGILLEF